MKFCIAGCGRVGADLAKQLSENPQNEVTIIDKNPLAFNRIKFSKKQYPNLTVKIGDMVDPTFLKSLDLSEDTYFITLMSGDNRNIFASLVAKKTFHVQNIFCRILDPQRCKIYNDHYGINCFSPTSLSIQECSSLIQKYNPNIRFNTAASSIAGEHKPEEPHKEFYIIGGGGEIGLQLAKRLISDQKETLILEKDPERIKYLKNHQLPESYCALADACEVSTLEYYGVYNADHFIAATGEDEDNLVMCQVIRSLNSKCAIYARVNNIDNIALFENENFTIINPTQNLIKKITTDLHVNIKIPGSVDILIANEASNRALCSFTVPANSIFAGKSADEFLRNSPVNLHIVSISSSKKGIVYDISQQNTNVDLHTMTLKKDYTITFLLDKLDLERFVFFISPSHSEKIPATNNHNSNTEHIVAVAADIDVRETDTNGYNDTIRIIKQG